MCNNCKQSSKVMETWHFICLLFLFFLMIFLIFTLRITNQEKNLPPTPRSLPIIGHLHLLKMPLPHCLQKLAVEYGPVVSLQLGGRPVILVSSLAVTEECFTKNDIIFSNRPKMASRKKLDYDFTAIGASPYGPHWRNLRRLTTLEIFSSTRVQMSSSIRTDEIRYVTKFLFSKENHTAHVKSLFYMMSFNIMLKTVCGQRYFEGDDFALSNSKTKNKNKYDIIKESFSPAQELALADIFPSLSWLSFVGLFRKKNKIHQNRDKFMQDLIDTSRNKKFVTKYVKRIGKTEPIIDVMLSLQESEPEVYPDTAIKGIVPAMLIAGTETSGMTMEAAVSFLISYPKILKKAREEINNNTEQHKLLEDEDLPKLPYLLCIINETLRLGPTVPLLPPRESSEDCTVGGYHVPQGTMLWVNVRALHTDPMLWDEPLDFNPERFEGSQGQKGDFKFIPFGMGRRQCPGATLAMRLMALTLGTLIQCFEWEKVKGDEIKIKFIPRKTYIPLFSESSELKMDG